MLLFYPSKNTHQATAISKLAKTTRLLKLEPQFMKLLLGIISIIIWTSNVEVRKTIIGNIESFNIEVAVEIDNSRWTDEISFEHVIKEIVIFKHQSKILKTEIINLKNLDGYVLSEIALMKSGNRNFYRMDYYRSNGSPEISIFYDIYGSRICKMNCPRNETIYLFIKKGYKKSFFDYDNMKQMKTYDLDLL
ncbi:MAG: hypothetical protein CFE24_06225 [Flavobacterium sp. BFFFF2]|nr:MAG: hypothetical protein CFE24_06225 [Flavobacterium sp. BFFFF2]